MVSADTYRSIAPAVKDGHNNWQRKPLPCCRRAARK
jgi:hypothetical protein